VARRRLTALGTTFTFTLNTPATVHFDFAHRATGRSVNGRCVAETKRNRRRRRCARNVFDGGFQRTGHAGLNSLACQGGFVSGVIGLGPHTAYVTAVNVSGHSATKTLQFTVAAS
jgi:hypothetical protein